MARPAQDLKILVCGAGIAGLTLAILLKERGFEPVLVEREHSLRSEGYMMDFFGTGFDVARRMGLTEKLRAIRYPIDRMELVDRSGRAVATLPIDRLQNALGGEYVYLRRSDLEKILFDRARAAGVDIRFGASLVSLADEGGSVEVKLGAGRTERFGLVIGADGLHSRIRGLVFGEEEVFSFPLGGYAAAFHLPKSRLNLDGAFRLHEATDVIAGFYPLGGGAVDTTIVFRHPNIDAIGQEDRPALLREKLSALGKAGNAALAELHSATRVYFDSLTQIRMPSWHSGRVALIGDACGCLTLLAGQGSAMAMAGAYVLATELQRHADHTAAFQAYEDVMEATVVKKQMEAEKFAGLAIPSDRSRPWLRRLAMRLMFSSVGLPFALRSFGAKSVLANYS